MMGQDSPRIEATTTTSGVPPRIQTIDMARGFAMLLVFCSHFSQIYFVEATPWADSLRLYATTIGFIATPTFVLTSGLVVGYLYQSRRADWSRLRIRLIDKAIFMITVGHLLSALFVTARSGMTVALTRGYVTDTIAFAVLLGMIIVPRTTRPVRLTLAGVLYGMAWFAWLFWNPTDPSGILVKVIFIGPPLEATNVSWFAMLPWASVYLVGSCLGEYKYIGSQRAKGLYDSVAVTLIYIAAGSIALSMTLRAVYEVLKAGSFMNLRAVPYAVVSLGQKYPPGPAYLLFFGGIGVLLIGILFLVARMWREQAVTQRLAELGQSSLIAYLLQFLVYYTALTLLVAKTDLTPVGLWPLYFLTSVALLLLLVRMSRRAGLNGLCTVGLPSLLQRWSRIQMAMQALALRMWLNGREAKDQGEESLVTVNKNDGAHPRGRKWQPFCLIGVAGVFQQTDVAEIESCIRHSFESSTNSGDGFGSDVVDQFDIDAMRWSRVDHRDRICIKGELAHERLKAGIIQQVKLK